MPSQFARNSAFGTVAGIAAAFGSFLISIIIAHLLGVEGSGTVSFTLWIVTLIATVADLGVSASLARYLPELTAQGELEQAKGLTAFLFKPLAWAGFAVLAAFGFYAGLLWIEDANLGQSTELASNWRTQPVMWLLIGAACIMQVLGSFAYGYLRGMQRFDRVAVFTVITSALQLGIVAVGSFAFGSAGVLGGICIGGIVPAAYAFSVVHRDVQISGELKRRVMRYARYAWAGGLASVFVWSRVEVFFLERSWGNEAVGLFTVALTFSNLAAQGPMLLTNGLLPYFSERFARNAIEEIRDGYNTATRIMGFLVFPACFGLAAIMPAALPFLYGQAFADAVPAATVLVIAASFGAVATVGSNLVSGLDRSDFIFVSGGTGAALSIFAGLTLIPTFGVIGAAWGRAAIQLAMIVFGMWFIMQRLQCPPPLRDLGRLLLAAALCAFAARCCIVLVPGVAALPVAISIGVVVYVVASRLLRVLPKDDVARLRSFCGRLPNTLRVSSEFCLQWMFGR
jgi:O-antigen/teichoic acid export membrane protein